MWLRWALVTAGIVGALIVLSIFVFGDSECRAWQKGYTVVYEEFTGRNGPFIENQVVEETNRRIGPRPESCEVPQPIDE